MGAVIVFGVVTYLSAVNVNKLSMRLRGQRIIDVDYSEVLRPDGLSWIVGAFAGAGGTFTFFRWVYFNAVKRNPIVVLDKVGGYTIGDFDPRAVVTVFDGKVGIRPVEGEPTAEGVIFRDH